MIDCDQLHTFEKTGDIAQGEEERCMQWCNSGGCAGTHGWQQALLVNLTVKAWAFNRFGARAVAAAAASHTQRISTKMEMAPWSAACTRMSFAISDLCDDFQFHTLACAPGLM